MRLSFAQVRSITRGIVRMEEADGLIHFHRFTEAQSKLYEQRDPDFFRKSKATSGVILEFDTDSQNLTLDVSVVSSSSRRFVVHSIFVNDQRIGQMTAILPENTDFAHMNGSFCLGQGMKRVKIYMPWTASSRLREMTLDDGATVIPVQKEKTIFLYGDSITQGYDAFSPENSYASQLTKRLGWNAINKAIAGEIFFPDLAAAPDAFTPDLISVAYGTNDWSRCSYQELRENCQGFYRNLRKTYPDTKIVVLAPIWRNDMAREDGACPFRQVAQLLRAIAEEIGNTVFIDCFEFIPQEARCFSADLLHPSDEGFHYYSKALISHFEANGLLK